MNLVQSKRIFEGSPSTSSRLKWWTKIYTINPFCIYYFGPFDQVEEAQISRLGYVKDLENEGGKVVFVKFLQLNPQDLTIEYKNLGRVRWLHEMMQDSLMLKVAYVPEYLTPEKG